VSELAEKSPSHSYLGREEIRGLFALGLLAVVASIRIQNSEITMMVDETSYDVTVFLDVVLVLWSFYAFFMVLGLSQDIIGDRASKMFQSVSTQYLYFSFVILGFLGIALFYFMYPTRAPWAFVFLIASLGYWLIKRVYLWKKKLPKGWKPTKSDFVSLLKNLGKKLKANSYQFLFSGFLVCFLLVIYGTREEFVIPSSIIGSIFLIGFLIAKDKKDKKSG
jgi:hypothetical protein